MSDGVLYSDGDQRAILALVRGGVDLKEFVLVTAIALVKENEVNDASIVRLLELIERLSPPDDFENFLDDPIDQLLAGLDEKSLRAALEYGQSNLEAMLAAERRVDERS